MATLVRSMKPALQPDVLVFLHLTNADNPPPEVGQKSVFMFREREGNTYVLPQALVERLGYQVAATSHSRSMNSPAGWSLSTYTAALPP